MKDVIFIVVFTVALLATVGLISFFFSRVIGDTAAPAPVTQMTPVPPPQPCDCVEEKDVEIVAHELFWALDMCVNIYEEDELVWEEIQYMSPWESLKASKEFYALESQVHDVWMRYREAYQGSEKWRRK